MNFLAFNQLAWSESDHYNIIIITKHWCRVIESKCPEFTVGELVVAQYGWQTHTISSAEKVGPDRISKIDPNLPFRPSTALGVLGMPGWVSTIMQLHIIVQLWNKFFYVATLDFQYWMPRLLLIKGQYSMYWNSMLVVTLNLSYFVMCIQCYGLFWFAGVVFPQGGGNPGR